MGVKTHLAFINHIQESIKDRKFIPTERYGQNIDLDLVEKESDDCFTRVACHRDRPCRSCGKLTGHFDCIFIAVDGACRGNGQAGAKAAVGVFFGENSVFNDGFILDIPNPTNQIAELTAGIHGLEKALAIQRDGRLGEEDLHQVVIKADSEYLVKGMTEWVFKWEGNGYRTARGTPVVNALLFLKLQGLVASLNNRNVQVLFWHVPRERNRDADAWANWGFDSGRVMG